MFYASRKVLLTETDTQIHIHTTQTFLYAMLPFNPESRPSPRLCVTVTIGR